MGSTGECNRDIDSSVGGLVWVQRRNGKWWPGRILGSEELPESCVGSPKSGTAVKLLGREDATVDWYNLEKSKRVKAFRCGEYDECIEKAKAAAANSTKKLAKNACKEHAILHALEIESAHLGKDHPDFYSRMEKPDDEEEHTIEASTSSFNPHKGKTDNMEDVSGSSYDDSNSPQELFQSGVSLEDPHHAGASEEQSVCGRQRQTPNGSEDDGTEGVKRMKGLGDLGMDVGSSLKRKRSQVAHVHDFLKKRHRRRTMTKVLESSVVVSVPVMCKASDSKLSGLESNEPKKQLSGLESNELKKKILPKENKLSSMFPENGSADGLYDVPFVAEEKKLAGLRHIGSSASQETYLGAQTQSTTQSDQVNEELNESGFAEVHSISQRIDNASSEWPLKGKRSRHSSKTKRKDSWKYMDADDECDTYLAGIEGDVSTYRVKSKSVAEIQVDEFQGQSTDTSNEKPYVSCAKSELPTSQRLLPCRRSRFNINPKYEDFSLKHHTAVSSLFDVNLEMEACDRPQYAPYVSLKSKLNGRPIIGHPLIVEVLEGDNLLSGSECYNSSCELGEDLAENTSAMRGVELDNEARSNPVEKIPQKRTSPPKSPKSRRNGFLTKKIRKLSSIPGAQKLSEEQKRMVVENPKVPAVACVPLKVVFSRISAGMNSSTQSAHRLSAASNA